MPVSPIRKGPSDTDPVIYDFRGRRIQAGCVVVYPQRKGSDMWMIEAVVEHVGVDPLGVCAYVLANRRSDHGTLGQDRRFIRNVERNLVVVQETQ